MKTFKNLNDFSIPKTCQKGSNSLSFLFITILLLCFCTVRAQENGSTPVKVKNYSDYVIEFEKEHLQWAEVPDTAMAFVFLKKAENENVIPLEIIVRQKIIDYFWNEKKYELAFEQYAIQSKRLEKISLEDMPEKLSYLIKIGDAYYFFKDYKKATGYYKEILDEGNNIHTPNIKQHARNDLGLCYRYGNNDLACSDSCFLTILEPENMSQLDGCLCDIWQGIAEGNTGYNMLLRGEYNKALPLLKSSLERTSKAGDYAYAARPAIHLANIYLKKGNSTEAKRYIDLAVEYYSKKPTEKLSSTIFETLSRYYATTGNTKLCMAYMDSTLAEITKHEKEFCALQLLRAEEKHLLTDKKLNEQQLHEEQIKKMAYKSSLIVSCIALLLIGVAFAHSLLLYGKKKNAYRKLAHKLQVWASVKTENYDFDTALNEEETENNEEDKQNGEPDEVDFLIMKDIEQLMAEEKLYRDHALTVDSLAHKLGAKRHYISNAINHCLKKNFNTYINEYRIKESIIFLSKKETDSLPLESIALEVGFSNYLNFYRVFKKMTGLSPAEFKKNNS